MILCDRCFKKATTTLNIIAGRGSVDVCQTCAKDYVALIDRFMEASDISIKAPEKVAPPIEAVDAAIFADNLDNRS